MSDALLPGELALESGLAQFTNICPSGADPKAVEQRAVASEPQAVFL